jgi:hypothetical protein
MVAELVEGFAELNDTDTAQAIWDALHLESKANRWGDEVYFAIPLTLGQEKGQWGKRVGRAGYWEPGKAFRIFFGKTPSRKGEEIRPASAVTVFGRLISNSWEFKRVARGTRITVEKRWGDSMDGISVGPSQIGQYPNSYSKSATLFLSYSSSSYPVRIPK